MYSKRQVESQKSLKLSPSCQEQPFWILRRKRWRQVVLYKNIVMLESNRPDSTFPVQCFNYTRQQHSCKILNGTFQFTAVFTAYSWVCFQSVVIFSISVLLS